MSQFGPDSINNIISFPNTIVFSWKKVVQWKLSPPTGSSEVTRWTHCPSRLQYLLVTKGLWALDLALPVVLHNHHGGVDFSHCEVCRCWESDKLTCKIRPFWNGPWAQGMVGKGCGARERDKKLHRNTEQTVFSRTDFLCLEVNKAKQ